MLQNALAVENKTSQSITTEHYHESVYRSRYETAAQMLCVYIWIYTIRSPGDGRRWGNYFSDRGTS